VIRVLPAVVELALLVFCLIDCVQSDPSRVRNLARGWWVVLIVVLPLVGGIAWLVAGRPLPEAPPRRTGFPQGEQPPAWESPRAVDERVRAEQARVDAEYDEAVRRATARREGPTAG